MATAQDVEISLGTGRLLGLFFGFVVVCGIFFGLGYTLGRSVGPAAMVSQASSPAAATNTAKPKPATGEAAQAANAPSANDLTFYKTVEQKDANPQLTPPSSPAPAAAASAAATDSAHASAYVVQVAAVSKKEDADALAGILRKKSYPVFLGNNSPGDSLFHVQVGPFNDIKDAEAMRGKLAGDGYSPIVKK
jgi:septal ring-binding cell division protein DamX